MPIMSICTEDPISCEIPRLSEGVWIDENEIYYYYDILLVNSDQTEQLNELTMFTPTAITGAGLSQVLTAKGFGNQYNKMFPVDINFTFFEDVIENRFIENPNPKKRTVDRPNGSAGWIVPNQMQVSWTVMGNGIPAGSVIHIVFPQPIPPGKKTNFRLLFKDSKLKTYNEIIRRHRQAWTGTIRTDLFIQAFDFTSLHGTKLHLDHFVEINDYRILFVLPPKADGVEWSMQPVGGVITHDYQMLSAQHGPKRLAYEFRSQFAKIREPFRIRGSYSEKRSVNWELTIAILGFILGILGFITGMLSLYLDIIKK